MDLVDLHLLVLVHQSPQIAGSVELVQARAGVVEALERAQVDIAHIVHIQQLPRLAQVCAGVDRGHVVDAPFDELPGQDRALLLLVPVPANNRGESGVDGHPGAPTVELGPGIGFENDGNALDVGAEPFEGPAVPVEYHRAAIVHVDRSAHVGAAVERFRDTVLESVADAHLGGADWVEQAGAQQQPEGPPPAARPGAA